MAHDKRVFIVNVLAWIYSLGTCYCDYKLVEEFRNRILDNSNYVKYNNIESLSLCGAVCNQALRAGDGCMTFFFNKHFKSCRISNGYATNMSQATMELGSNLYRKIACPDSYTLETSIYFCYKVYDIWKTNDECKEICAADGGMLAVFDTEEKFEIAKIITHVNQFYAYRIDGNYTSANEWRYSNGNLMDMRHFNPGTAHFWNDRRCCQVHYHDTTFYYGNDCNSKNRFICEIPLK